METEKNKGFSLILSFIVIVIIVLVGAVVGRYIIYELQFITIEESRKKAYNSARTGAQAVMQDFYFNFDDYFSGIDFEQYPLTATEIDFNSDEVEIDTIRIGLEENNNGGYFWIESIGTYDDQQETVYITIDIESDFDQFFEDGFTTGEQLTINAGANVEEGAVLAVNNVEDGSFVLGGDEDNIAGITVQAPMELIEDNPYQSELEDLNIGEIIDDLIPEDYHDITEDIRGPGGTSSIASAASNIENPDEIIQAIVDEIGEDAYEELVSIMEDWVDYSGIGEFDYDGAQFDYQGSEVIQGYIAVKGTNFTFADIPEVEVDEDEDVPSETVSFPGNEEEGDDDLENIGTGNYYDTISHTSHDLIDLNISGEVKTDNLTDGGGSADIDFAGSNVSFFVEEEFTLADSHYDINAAGEPDDLEIIYSGSDDLNFGDDGKKVFDLFVTEDNVDIEIGSGIDYRGDIIVTGEGGEINISGAANIEGDIIAPESEINVEAGADVTGALVGDVGSETGGATYASSGEGNGNGDDDSISRDDLRDEYIFRDSLH